jgi:hypothetical protein
VGLERGTVLSEQPAPGASGWVFKEIKTQPPERPRIYRSISFLTYATIGAVGVNAFASLIQLAALVGQWRLLSRMANHDFATQDGMVAAAQASDGLVALAAVLTFLTLMVAYVVASFWIYNAACNIRALGGRGFQISPGWAVGWYAVPIAWLWKPFQAMEEIYLASASPASWQQLKTPLLLRFWWGAFLLAGVTGYIVAIASRSMTAIPDLIGMTQFELVDIAVDLVACALFLTIVWRIFRAQVHNRSQVGEVAQVFA